MERAAWTDERLDDLLRRFEARFDRVEARFDRLDARIDALQMTLVRVGGGVIIGLVGVIAAVIARG